MIAGVEHEAGEHVLEAQRRQQPGQRQQDGQRLGVRGGRPEQHAQQQPGRRTG